MTIQYVLGDATQPIGDGFNYIVHVVNDANRWGAGFVLSVSKRWPWCKTQYHDWMRRNSGKAMLGALQLVPVTNDVIVANLVGQHGLRPINGIPPVRYGAIDRALCLLKQVIVERTPAASCHMPMIGCGLSGGRWSEVEPLVRKHLVAAGINVTVYRLEGFDQTGGQARKIGDESGDRLVGGHAQSDDR